MRRFFANLLLAALVFVARPANGALDCSAISSCSACAGQQDPDDAINACIWCVNGNRCISTESSTVCSLRDLILTAYDCPVDPLPGFVYDDQATRATILPLIAAVYGNGDQPQTCLTNQNLDFVVQRIIQVPCDNDALANDKCTLLTAVSQSQKTIAVSFRGSENTLEIIHEILTIVEPNVAFVGGGKVFPYFHEAFYRLWRGGLEAELTRLRQQYPDYKLVSVGHSLGASLASVFATFIASQGPWQADDVSFVGFGQPRTGDIEYAMAHDRLNFMWMRYWPFREYLRYIPILVPRTREGLFAENVEIREACFQVKYSYRVIHRRDIYAHLPPPAFGNNTFSHHRFEVWYQNDMAPGRPYTLCTRPDDFSCSNGQWDLSFNDHDSYFNKNLERWLNQGCT